MKLVLKIDTFHRTTVTVTPNPSSSPNLRTYRDHAQTRCEAAIGRINRAIPMLGFDVTASVLWVARTPKNDRGMGPTFTIDVTFTSPDTLLLGKAVFAIADELRANSYSVGNQKAITP